MANIIRIIFALVTFAFATYVFITESSHLAPFMLTSLGFMLLASGSHELKKGRNANAVASFVTSAFVLTVAILTI
ncbi:DUF3953 domain-containing protein [Halobacillus mangrovi]|uniref:DUF3953 domain-containing protein n=1 Tax=Halobacillus mangrovi TaxID=402384 RepID=UPI0018DBE8A9|nr:DUF3953 domain-containing protein [Halobacillus mangrovi]